jgi:predicted ATPase/class 3 adenylate cyclase
MPSRAGRPRSVSAAVQLGRTEEARTRTVRSETIVTETSRLPTGTVTFLFTDIEGSTRLVRELGPRWHDVLEEHNGLMRDAIRGAWGVDLRTEGDAVFAVFESAAAAVSAAVVAQKEIASRSWPEPLRVRMGLHTGEGVLGGDDYVGLDVHRAARIAAAGHGGQVLLSGVTRALVERALPAGVTLRSLGRHRLKGLSEPEDLHQLVIDRLPFDFGPPKTLEVPTNLAAPLTSFVGRNRELARVGELLKETRLLTLTGPGGCGKTRLAIEAATHLLPAYSDGVFFVELAPITDPALVPSTIAVALGVREEPARPIQESLKDALRDRETLIVLDNFEQLLIAAPLITELLSVSPRLRVLVTSRAALHLSGEQQLPVPPLKLPDTRDPPPTDRLREYEAVALFAERAAAVNPDFALTDENAPDVARICARLDGLPLAIELAASRVKLLPPSAMLDRLQDRLDFLTGGARDVPARQRALRETIRWSYDLLERSEQSVFHRLATFVGGWTIEAAEAVANPPKELGVETLEVMSSLVDESLVQQEIDDGDLRFGMLGTIREFGIDALEDAGEADQARHRHAKYFLAMAEAAEPELTIRDQVGLGRLEREHDNLRAAMRWSIDTGDAETGLRLAGYLWRFWQLRGHLAEGRRWTDELLAMPAARNRTASRAKALSAAGSLAYWLRDTNSLRGPYEESLAIYRELGDRRGEAEAAYNLGFANLLSGDLRAAQELYRRAAEIHRDLDDPIRLAHATAAQGMVAYQEGDLETTEALVEEAHVTFQDVGDLWGIVLTSGLVCALALRGGDYDRARPAAIEALEANLALGNTLGNAVSIQALAVLAVRLGRPEAGVRLAGAIDRIKEVAGGEAPPAIVGLEDPREIAKDFLTEGRIAELWEEGRAMRLDEAIALARRQAELVP